MTRAHRFPRVFSVAVAVGVSLIITGIILVLRQPAASFGWFAYAPLTPDSAAPVSIMLGPFGIAGIVSLVLGFGVLAFASGWMIGRRRAAAPDSTPR